MSSPNLWGLLSQTSRIITAQPRHFFALAALFLLPVSILNIIYLSLLQPTSIYPNYGLSLTSASTPNPQNLGNSQFPFQILYLLSVLCFGLSAGASITYTTFLGFHGKPASFISSLKSILVSFFPLLSTQLVSQIIIALIAVCFGIFMVLAYSGLLLFGVELDYGSACFVSFVVVIVALLVAALIYLQVQWLLITAVVVVESKWGFAPLKRSWYLVKGKRGLAFSVILFFLVLGVPLSMWSSSLVINGRRNGKGWSAWEFVLQMIVCVGLSTAVSLYSMAANTVLFIYCKASKGKETSSQTNDMESGVVYVQLPSGNGEV